MDERTLLRVSLACSVIGLCALFLISSSSSFESVDIERVDGTSSTAVKVFGTVESVRVAGMGQAVVISRPSSIEVFASSPTSLQRGDIVEVIGIAEEYHGEAQIVAQRIRVVRAMADDP